MKLSRAHLRPFPLREGAGRRGGCEHGPAASRAYIQLLAGLLALGLLTACGKKGAPAPPGPQNEIIFPKTYPSR